MSAPSELELIARLLVAAACGALVGFDRERRDRPAGLRTFMLVSSGAALFGIVSIVGFRASGNGFEDPGRVAAQVVVGVGFLGAAAIIRDRRGIIGVTTAASVWMMAAVGLAASAGLYLIAVAATLLTFAILTVARRLERAYRLSGTGAAPPTADRSETPPRLPTRQRRRDTAE
ncbi:MAG: MgtC/SapB family protein [Chloroflexota bacterium]|nr:MgtC/SapB family protein [Dehalococcoidia bacterium]MDW8252389.1 MgtC/SapB family protein [Chloroflexota bacterium]